MATDGKQSTARRDLLQQIEADVQKKWEKQKAMLPVCCASCAACFLNFLIHDLLFGS